MSQKMKLSDGREVNVQEDIKNEDWNEYRLLDGGKVRLKTVVQRIMLIVDDEGRTLKDRNGDPEVAIRHATQVVASDTV